MIILSKLSENLQELMAEHDLNQVTLAEKLHTGRSKFSDILHAKNAPNYKTLIALIEYFSCSADFLLGLREDPCDDINYRPVLPFGERLRDMLQQTSTSQYEFIRTTNISWSVLYHWLKGQSFPSADNLVKVARYFDCSVDFLLGRV